MSKNLNERQEIILKELRAFIENCTTYCITKKLFTPYILCGLVSNFNNVPQLEPDNPINRSLNLVSTI